METARPKASASRWRWLNWNSVSAPWKKGRNRGVADEMTLKVFFIIHDSPFTNRGFHPLKEGALFFTIHYSLFTIHYSLFTIHAPVITCYGRESNPKPSIKSVCCAISPCICPVFTGGIGEREYLHVKHTRMIIQ